MPPPLNETEKGNLLALVDSRDLDNVYLGLELGTAHPEVFAEAPFQNALRARIYEIEYEAMIEPLIAFRSKIPIIDRWLTTYEKVAVLRGDLPPGYPIDAITIQHLNFSTLGQIGEVPEPIELLPVAELPRLFLTDCGLRKLDPSLVEFKSLRELYLGGNRLGGFPPQLRDFPDLESLALFDNGLTTVGPDILALKKLKWLSLAENPLEVFPPELFRLPNLESISLAECDLAVIPPRIKHLTKLKSLTLSDNHIRTLPPEIYQLPDLQYIELSGNPIQEAPVPPSDARNRGIQFHFS
ncbi:MAG: leucine-rich repeat domain-containing protein [Bacteroidota bacterium]